MVLTPAKSARCRLSQVDRDFAGGNILLLHDGNSALTDAGVRRFEVLPRLLHALREARLHSVTLRSAIP